MAHIRQSRPDSGLDFQVKVLIRFQVVARGRAQPRGVFAAGGGPHGPSRKVDIRLPGKGNSKSHGARPVHQIITMIKWTRTSRLSIKNSLSAGHNRAAFSPQEVALTDRSKL